jgi:hypothetical protein
VLERNGFVSFAMLPSALLGSLLFGGSVHCEIHLDSDNQEGAAIFRAVSAPLRRVDQVRNLRSRLMLDPKRSDTHREAVHLALGPLCQDHHLLLFFSFALLELRFFL